MKRTLAFSSRNAREIFRDPINICFGIGFPVLLLLLLTAIQSNISVSLFELEHLTPGMTVFGLSFLTLFSATLVAKDRESAFLQRLYTTPLRATHFIFGYIIPLLPMGLAQAAVCYIVAFFLGLNPSIGVIYSLLLIIPVSLLFISVGLLCGSLLNSKQVGGICGAFFTNVCAFLSGIWFDLELAGGFFKGLASALPFCHAVELERAVYSQSYENFFFHFCVILAYTVLATVLAVVLFLRQMNKH